jgi:hypothetical protein
MRVLLPVFSALALAVATSAPAAARGSLAPCKDHAGFQSTTLTIVTTVNPSAGKTWTFPEAPSVVAQRLLSDLNANTRYITFKEANGVVPNLYLYVTLDESNAGTQRDSAYVRVTGLALPGTLFNESSGPAPFIGWHDAIDHLATNTLSWLYNGWTTRPPCQFADGRVKRA